MKSFVRALISKSYVSLIVGALWYGGQRITWPEPARIVGGALALAAIAGLGHFFVYWTRTFGEGLRFVEVTIRVAAWLGVSAAVVLWMVAEPRIGILGGAFLLYMAGDAKRELLARWFSKLRFEDAALRRDHPNYRPAVSATLWPDK